MSKHPDIRMMLDCTATHDCLSCKAGVMDRYKQVCDELDERDELIEAQTKHLSSLTVKLLEMEENVRELAEIVELSGELCAKVGPVVAQARMFDEAAGALGRALDELDISVEDAEKYMDESPHYERVEDFEYAEACSHSTTYYGSDFLLYCATCGEPIDIQGCCE